jgi:hypothetical protein
MFDEQLGYLRLAWGMFVCAHTGHRMSLRVENRLAYRCDRCGHEETDEEALRRMDEDW